MAKFGTIHNWLDYDSIRMAGVTKEMANIVGKSIGAASVLGGEVVDQAFRNYETKEDKAKKLEIRDKKTIKTLESLDELFEEEDALELVSEAERIQNELTPVQIDENEFNPQKNQGKGSKKITEENEETPPPPPPPPVPPQDENFSFNTFESLFPTFGRGIDGNITSITPIGLDAGLTPEQETLSKIRRHFDKRNKERKASGDISSTAEMAKYIRSLGPGEQNIFAKSIGKESWLDLDSLTDRDFEEYLLPGTYGGIGNKFTKAPTKRLNLTDPSSKAPFPRLSPLGRYKETPLNQMQDMLEYGTISEASMPDYLGKIGKAAEQGYNRAVQKFNYNLKVQKERLKGINEQYSSLKVDPTGLSSLDANLKILGKSMQGAYMELMSKEKSMNPFDFMQEKQKLLEQPVIINQAIKTLQQRVKDFNDNRYEVGQATNAKTIDILDTLSKGGGNLKPIYKDGVPYLVGTTLGGQDVDVAISEIANGNNDFKFIKSETVQPFIDDIIKDYTATEKYYTEGGGIMERKKLRPGWEQVATSKFKEALKMKGEPGMRGYAALFGTNFDGYNKMLEQGEDIEGFLVDSFLNRVNQEFQPYAQSIQTGQLRPTKTSTTQSERNIAITKARLDKKGNITKDNYEEFLNLVEGYQGKYIARVENNILQVADNTTGKIRLKIDLSKPLLAKQSLANLAGVTGYQGGQQQDIESLYNFDL